MASRLSITGVVVALVSFSGCQLFEDDSSAVVAGVEWPFESTSEHMLVWVASTEALRTCQLLPQRLRMLERLGGDDLDLLLFHVGEEDSAPVARNVLKRERLSADYRRMSEEVFRSSTHEVRFPGLYFVKDQMIILGQQYSSERDLNIEMLATAVTGG